MSAIVSPVVRTPLPCQLCKQLCTMQCGVPVQRWLCWVHTLHRLEKEHLPGGFTECLLQLCFNTAPPLLIHSENPSHMMCPPQILSGQDSVTHSRLEFYGRPQPWLCLTMETSSQGTPASQVPAPALQAPSCCLCPWAVLTQRPHLRGVTQCWSFLMA